MGAALFRAPYYYSTAASATLTSHIFPDMSLNPDVLAALNESSTLSLINELVVLRKVTQSTPDFQKVANDVYYCRIGFKHPHLEKI
jgi:hypothetical protein